MEQDIKQLIEATDQKIDTMDQKNEDRFIRLFEVAVATKEGVVELNKRVERLELAVEALTNSVDKIIKELTDLRTEYYAMSNQLTRHEKWIQMIAEKVGIKLGY